jgi:hypothetical protein
MQPEIGSRNDDGTTTACAVCRRSFQRIGRQRFCSAACRQMAWRRRHPTPQPVIPPRSTHDQAPSTNAQRVGPALWATNIARTAAASAAASVRVDSARRVTNRSRSPISSSREVIAQNHPDSRLWGNLMAASGAKLMTAHGEIS